MPKLEIVRLYYPDVYELRSALSNLVRHKSMTTVDGGKMLIFTTHQVYSKTDVKEMDIEVAAICSQICGLMLNIADYGTPLIEGVLHYMRNALGGKGDVTRTYEDEVGCAEEPMHLVKTIVITDGKSKVIFKERGKRSERFCELVVIVL